MFQVLVSFLHSPLLEPKVAIVSMDTTKNFQLFNGESSAPCSIIPLRPVDPSLQKMKRVSARFRNAPCGTFLYEDLPRLSCGPWCLLYPQRFQGGIRLVPPASLASGVDIRPRHGAAERDRRHWVHAQGLPVPLPRDLRGRGPPSRAEGHLHEPRRKQRLSSRLLEQVALFV